MTNKTDSKKDNLALEAHRVAYELVDHMNDKYQLNAAQTLAVTVEVLLAAIRSIIKAREISNKGRDELIDKVIEYLNELRD